MFGLGAIVAAIMPLVTAAITAYNKSKDVSITAIQSAGSIASAQVQAMTLWIGHPFSPPSIMCYAVAFHFSKAVVYDPHIAVLIFGKAGFTPFLEGGTKEIAMIVVSGMFFSGIARIVRSGQ
jgi:hypothetical protein